MQTLATITTIDPERFNLVSAATQFIDHNVECVPDTIDSDPFNLQSQSLLAIVTQWLKTKKSSLAAADANDREKLPADTHTVRIQSLLNALSSLLLCPTYTMRITYFFRPILLDLVARWCLSDAPNVIFDPLFTPGTQAYLPIVVVSVALSRLLPNYPQARGLMSTFFTGQSCLISSIAPHWPSSVLETVIEAAYRLLELDYRGLATLWDWDALTPFTKDATEPRVRYFATQALATRLGMSDQERQQVLAQNLTAEECQSFLLDPVLYHERLLREQDEIERVNLKRMLSQSAEESLDVDPVCIQPSDFSPLTVNLCGVLLPAYHHEAEPISSSSMLGAQTRPELTHQLVLTPTTVNNMHAISLAVSLGEPVLLEGSTGAGKTNLVEDLAHVLGHRLLKIHLGDQADPKVLLGTYVTTSTPGKFRWQPGVLTSAVQQGWWVLFEDIDLAPMEIISALLPLLEERTLFITSRGERLVAHHRFQLFATKVVTELADGRWISRNASGDLLLGNLWTKVPVRALPPTELIQVTTEKHPVLSTMAVHLVELYQRLVQNFSQAGGRTGPAFGSSARGRVLSPRDFFKWMGRLNDYFDRSSTGQPASLCLNDTDRTMVFQEAMDCFSEMIPNVDDRQMLLITIAEGLGMTDAHALTFDQTHRPALQVTQTEVVAGRIRLPKCHTARGVLPRGEAKAVSSHFAYTSQSLRMLERIAGSIRRNEPVLLVGETGAGKTTVVQHLATLLHQKLHVINLSQQSDASDLLGGFKPVDARVLVLPLKEEFEKLFEQTFSMRKNAAYLEKVRTFYAKKQWKKLVLGFQGAVKMAEQRFERLNQSPSVGDGAQPEAKRPRREAEPRLVEAWDQFTRAVEEFRIQLDQIDRQLIFTFVEGTLVKAIREGHWVLLDEMNLASSETLESLSDLLQSTHGSVLLSERGDEAPVPRHPNFRVFACMNPSTDVGKRELPPGLRSRFSEFYAFPPDTRMDDLLMIIGQYVGHLTRSDTHTGQQVADFYLAAKELATKHSLVDGAQQRPHYSIRTLTRALRYAAQAAPHYPLRRALYDGLVMTFVTQLEPTSQSKLKEVLGRYILAGVKGNHQTFVTRTTTQGPELESTHTLFGSYWIRKGEQPVDPQAQEQYILTPSVRQNLTNLARVVMCGQYPVLIQGPTSSGKTSMVEFLAKVSGHNFVRINNHEHTDIQEYLGTYVSVQGKLVFQEGILVQALRRGYWIVLDELNLAPSDVLEALNRLLDDNRELRIPETQETVRPHPHFMLFATQNPAGLYGGRKMLSRAFRNRFVELHFDDIPEDELETILATRCQIAPSYCKRMVQVYRKLTERRQTTRIFETKHGFITLRDMFRWALRHANGYQELAEHGYMILGERVRNPEEKQLVRRCLEEVMRVKLDEKALYRVEDLPEYQTYCSLVRDATLPEIAWTSAMRRLFSLVVHCVSYREPVLLVGETGAGKTTVCQVLAAVLSQQLLIVNCHQHTETADILGGQRPIRQRTELQQELQWTLTQWGQLYDNLRSLPLDHSELTPVESSAMTDDEPEPKTNLSEPTNVEQFDQVLADPVYRALCDHHPELQQYEEQVLALRERCSNLFEWQDGPLVQAMKSGEMFLLDEISLADDSVLERLNSILEPSGVLVLAEKGSTRMEQIVGADKFRFLATMNPGGDYGKRELSPALRNRFTEIWVPAVTDPGDLHQILVERNRHTELVPFAMAILKFTQWFVVHLPHRGDHVFSLRDYLTWTDFMNATFPRLSADEAYVYGGRLTILDGLGSHGLVGGFASEAQLRTFSVQCLTQLRILAAGCSSVSPDPHTLCPPLTVDALRVTDDTFAVGPFTIPKGPLSGAATGITQFTFRAPTTFANLTRLLSGMQVAKPILMEGSPGVGKTSLVASLAATAGHQLVRINLSEQTDLMDLFGSDLPVEGGASGEFTWCDAAFLKAMKEGSWVLLDEINLASQSVLEGLNSCLDHRGVVFIPELDREFPCKPGFKIFAAQNPLQQGGGRKGLPKSFINRFTQIYVEQLKMDDYLVILRHAFPQYPAEPLERMLAFNQRMHQETMTNRSFGQRGQPWEFNLRDVFRWLHLVTDRRSVLPNAQPVDYLALLYLQRMRTEADRKKVLQYFAEYFGGVVKPQVRPCVVVETTFVQIGSAVLPRRPKSMEQLNAPWTQSLNLLQGYLPLLGSIMRCVQQGWMPILVGDAATGKTNLVRLLALLTGNPLLEFSMNSAVDSMELLGGFEQVDLNRHRTQLFCEVTELVQRLSVQLLLLDGGGDSIVCLPHDGVPGLPLSALTTAYRAAWKEYQAYAQSSETATGGTTSHRAYPQFTRLLHTLEQVYQTLPEIDREVFTSTLSSMRSRLTRIRTMESQDVRGRFEWIDGVLIQALEQGHWLLIDNANLCNPSILDRLNGLLEPHGSLAVHERGLVGGDIRTVTPHPNFRIFMTCNPQFGELSRAMRNRGIEIALLGNECAQSYIDLLRLVTQHGVGNGPWQITWLTQARQHFPELLTPEEYSTRVHSSDKYDMCAKATGDTAESVGLPTPPHDDAMSEELVTRVMTIQSQKNLRDILQEIKLVVETQQRGAPMSHTWSKILTTNTDRQWDSLWDFYNAAVPRWGMFQRGQGGLTGLLNQSSYLAYLLLRDTLPDTEQSSSLSTITLDNARVAWQPTTREILDKAGVTFLTYLSPTDAKERQTLLKYLGTHLACTTLGSQVIEALTETLTRLTVHPVFRALQYTRDWLFTRLYSGGTQPIGITDQAYNVLFNSTLHQALSNGPPEAPGDQLYGTVFRAYQACLALSQLVTRALYAKVCVTQKCHVGKDSHPRDMSALQLSHWYCQGKILSTSHRVLPVVRSLVPYLESQWQVLTDGTTWLATKILECFDNTDTLDIVQISGSLNVISSIHDTLECIYTQYSRLVKHSQSQTLDMSVYANVGQVLDRCVHHPVDPAFRQAVEAWGSFTDQTVHWGQVIGLKTCEISSHLWHQWHPSQLTKPTLLASLSSAHEVWGVMQSSPVSQVFTNAPLDAPNQFVADKKILLQTVATLYALESRGLEGAGATLLTSLQESIAQLKDRYAPTKEDKVHEPVPTLESSPVTGNQDTEAFSAFVNYTNYRKGQRVAHNVQLLLDNHRQEDLASVYAPLPGLLKDFLGHSLTMTSRSPLELVAHQRLLWILETDQPTTPDALTPLVNEVVGIAAELPWRGALIWSPSNPQPDIPSQGPAVFNRAILSECVFLATAGVSRTSLERMNLHLGQLHHVTSQLLDLYPLVHDPLRDDTAWLVGYQLRLIHWCSDDRDITPTLTYGNWVQYFVKFFSNPAIQATTATLPEGLSGTETNLFATMAGHPVPPVAQKYLIQSLTCTAQLIPWLTSTVAHPQGSQEAYRWMSLGYVFLGLGLLALLVPETAVDPAMKYILEWQWLHQDKHDLVVESVALNAVERMTTGNPTNAAVQRVLDQLNILTQRIASFNARVVTRPTVSQFPQLFLDLGHLLHRMLAETQLQRVLPEDGKVSGPEQQRTARFMQDNLAHYLVRIRTKYPDYGDFLDPVAQCIALAQVGIGYTHLPESDTHLLDLADTRGLTRDGDALKWFMKRMLQFPFFTALGSKHSPTSLATSDMLHSLRRRLLNKTEGQEPNFNLYLTTLQTLLRWLLRCHHNQVIDWSTFALVWERLFGEVQQLWLAVDQRQKAEAAQQQAMYKYKESTFTADDPEVADEHELKALFPSFADELQGLDGNDETEDVTQVYDAVENEDVGHLNLDQKVLTDIVTIHQQVFTPRIGDLSDQNKRESISGASELAFVTQCHHLVGSLTSYLPSLGWAFDPQFFPAHLATLVHMPDQEKADTTLVTSYQNSLALHYAPDYSYDYYNDANLIECQTVLDLLLTLRTRIGDILQVWPEQPVLEHLRSIVGRLLGFPVTSPVAKFLAGLELLLQKSDDWESYSSREFSLKPLLDRVVRLIIHWRQLELNSWPQLFDVEDRRQKSQTTRWWLYLYSLVVMPLLPPGFMAGDGPLDSVTQSSESADENDPAPPPKDAMGILQALVQYIRSSPLGEFHSRLVLLRTFSYHVAQLVRLENNGGISHLDRDGLLTPHVMARVLEHTYTYYSMYNNHLAQVKRDLRKPIEKEMRNFVRVASFKDVNVFALKASAVKTHHELHKCLKRYRQMLRQPVDPLITQFDNAITLETSEKAFVGEAIVPKFIPTETKLEEGKSFRKSLLLRKHRRRLGQQSPELLHMVLDHLESTLTPALTITGELETLDNSDLLALHQQVVENPSYQRLDTLPKAAATLASMIQHRTLYRDRLTESHTLAKLAHLVIERALELRNNHVPPFESPTNPPLAQRELTEAKYKAHHQFYKRLKVLKQKALTDLLKHLKVLGLKHRRRADIQQQLQMVSVFTNETVQFGTEYLDMLQRMANWHGIDQTIVRSLVHPLHGSGQATWHRADRYYQRTLARLTLLQQLAHQGGSPDLAPHHIQRFLAATESACWQMQSERILLDQVGRGLARIVRLALQWVYIDPHWLTAQEKKEVEGMAALSLESSEPLSKLNAQTVPTPVVHDRVLQTLVSLDQTTHTLVQGIEQALTMLRHPRVKVAGHSSSAVETLQEFYTVGSQWCGTLTDHRVHLEQLLLNSSKLDTICFFRPSLQGDLVNCQTWLATIPPGLTQLLDREPPLGCFLHPLVTLVQENVGYQSSDDTVSLSFALDYVRESQPVSTLDLAAQVQAPTWQDAVGAVSKFIDGMLLVFQQVRSLTRSTENNSDQCIDELELGLPQNALVTPPAEFKALQRALAMEQVADLLILVNTTCRTVFLDPAFSRLSKHYLAKQLRRARHFLYQYLRLGQHAVVDFTCHHGALCKLSYVLCNTFSVLLRDGFCTPEFEGEGEGDEGPEGNGKLEEGTGIGEGRGEKNVSDEIENEDQVLGTENEEKDDSPQQDPAAGEDAIEMENDFEGEIGDAQYTDVEDDSGPSDGEDEEPELEDRIGDVNLDDPSAVDDKLWDGDDEDDTGNDRDTEAQLDDNQQLQSQGEKDIVAKEEEEESAPAKKSQPESTSAERGEDKDPADDNSDGEPDELGITMDPEDVPTMDPQQGDTMDLPDDMGMSDGGESDNEAGSDQDELGLDDMETDNMDQYKLPVETKAPREDEDDDGDEVDEEQGDQTVVDKPLDSDTEDPVKTEKDDTAPPAGPETEDGADGDTAMDVAEDNSDTEAKDEEDGEEAKPDEEADSAEPPPAPLNPDELNAVPGEEPMNEEDDEEFSDAKHTASKPEQDDAAIPETYGTEASRQDQDSQPIKAQETKDDAHSETDPSAQPDQIDRPDAHTGESSAFDQEQQTGATQDVQDPSSHPAEQDTDNQGQAERPLEFDRDANPYRSLADAQESWSRRLHMMDRQDMENEPTPLPEAVPPESESDPAMEVDTDQAYEFTRENETHAHATLADATQTDPTNEEEDPWAHTILEDMEPDVEDPTASMVTDPSNREEELSREVGMSDILRDLLESDSRNEQANSQTDTGSAEQGALVRSDRDSLQPSKSHIASTELHEKSDQADDTLGKEEAFLSDLDPEAANRLREELVVATQQWQKRRGLDPDAALALWKRYEMLTHDLALSLCEQLRLILEPTLATKLKGDYRTGKRLSMKKIIPYIASQYKKDKIWLRRTKPSKRQYQILIAVDDSKSMAESHSVELAFETLALVSKALSQLESGDIGVVSFGETTRVLHGFDQPFTMESGAQLLTDFTFEQTKTDVVRLMSDSLTLFQQVWAQSSHRGPGAGDLWQLQLILSDGVCEHHDRLRALVRRGMENRIMVVFIVMDNKPDNQSILHLNNVRYQQVDGKLSLQMDRYLDTFPFTYYLVLRDIKALPLVLSDALRQYFSLVAES
ncbi:AAA ATPase midasin [Dispira simplex]|nr:AAA ATPase midasin [Dispira simplex]